MADDLLLWDELHHEQQREQRAHLNYHHSKQQGGDVRGYNERGNDNNSSSNANTNNGVRMAQQFATRLESAVQQTAQALTTAAAIAVEKGKDVIQNAGHHHDRTQQRVSPQTSYRAGGYGASMGSPSLYGPLGAVDNHPLAGGQYCPPSLGSSSHAHEDDLFRNGSGDSDDNEQLPFSNNSANSFTGRGLLTSSIFSSDGGRQNVDTRNYQPLGGNPAERAEQSRSSPYHIHPEPSITNAKEKEDFEVVAQFRRHFRLEGWGAVADLDTFFASVYNYYRNKGIVHIVGKGVIELLSLFFTYLLSIFLFAYVDWNRLLQCKDESTCQESFGSYIIDHPFSTFSWVHFLLIVYSIIFISYGILSCFRFYSTVREALYAKIFYEEKLGISPRKLEGGAVEWDEIVTKIMDMQRSGEYRVAIHGEELDALSIAQRILRKENYMVAFINQNILDFRLPVPWPLPSDRGFTKSGYICTTMEWTLHVCLLDHIFNRQHKIRPSFYDSNALRRRFIMAGVVHLFMMPFLVCFMTLHFLLVNLYVWKSSNEYMGPREWTQLAKWTFREFNELPHVFERRLSPSYTAAEDYLKLFSQNAIVSYMGRALLFVSGSLVAILLSFAAINDAIVLHVKIYQWNLLWYIGILGIAFSIGKGMLPDEKIHPSYTYNMHAEMEAALTRVASHTHHFPDFWKKRSWKEETHSAFSFMFQNKSKLFVLEILSTLVAPYVLIVRLPQIAVSICSFVNDTKVELPGLGDVCGYGCFDFNAFEDENWEGRQMTSPKPTTGRDEYIYYSSSARRQRPKARQGKMEKSFFSFKVSHPSWICGPSGQTLVDRVQRFCQLEQERLAKERQLYVEGAARQLMMTALRSTSNQSTYVPSAATAPTAPVVSPVDHNTTNSTNPADYSIPNVSSMDSEGRQQQQLQQLPPPVPPPPRNDEMTSSADNGGGRPRSQMMQATGVAAVAAPTATARVESVTGSSLPGSSPPPPPFMLKSNTIIPGSPQPQLPSSTTFNPYDHHVTTAGSMMYGHAEGGGGGGGNYLMSAMSQYPLSVVPPERNAAGVAATSMSVMSSTETSEEQQLTAEMERLLKQSMLLDDVGGLGSIMGMTMNTTAMSPSTMLPFTSSSTTNNITTAASSTNQQNNMVVNMQTSAAAAAQEETFMALERYHSQQQYQQHASSNNDRDGTMT